MNREPASDAWERGDPYERYIGRWSRQVAPRFLAWLNMPAGRRWLDVGCGTGALCAAILDHGSPASVVGVEPSNGFRTAAQATFAGRAAIYPGTASDIPLRASSIDVAVSGLVFNFVPNPHAALTEMKRVTGSGGVIGLYVWDYADKMELLRYFWDAIAELHPGAAALDEGIRFPICHPEALRQSFAGAGLEQAEVTAIDIPTHFLNFDDYWQPFLGGTGPAPAYVASLDPTARDNLREHLRLNLPTQVDGSISLIARAWAIRVVVDQ